MLKTDKKVQNVQKFKQIVKKIPWKLSKLIKKLLKVQITAKDSCIKV